MYNVITLPPLTSFFLASTSRPQLQQEKGKRRFSFYINTHIHIKIKLIVATVSKSSFGKEVSPGSLVSAAAWALHSWGQLSQISHAILLVEFAIIHHCQMHIKDSGKKRQPLLAFSPPLSLNHHWSPHCCSLPSWLQELPLLWAQLML